MLKHLMNGSSLLALALRDANNDEGSARDKARAELIKNNTITSDPPVNADPGKTKPEGDDEGDDDGDDEEGEEEGEEGEEKEEGEKEEETEEQKKEREAKEKLEAKAKRKEDRMQRRIDAATARAKEAEDRIAALEAQLKADPDKTLTEQEIQKRAKDIADKAIADKELAKLQEDFEKACDKLAKDAAKIDPEFHDKIDDIAQQFGPIPSFMIGVLEDFDNGGEVLAYIADNDEIAEKIYNLKSKPAKMTKELVTISNQLAEAKKPKIKKLSKVPDPVKPVKPNGNIQSLAITDADTKDMDKYVAKRQRQMEEAKKARGF